MLLNKYTSAYDDKLVLIGYHNFAKEFGMRSTVVVLFLLMVFGISPAQTVKDYVNDIVALSVGEYREDPDNGQDISIKCPLSNNQLVLYHVESTDPGLNNSFIRITASAFKYLMNKDGLNKNPIVDDELYFSRNIILDNEGLDFAISSDNNQSAIMLKELTSFHTYYYHKETIISITRNGKNYSGKFKLVESNSVDNPGNGSVFDYAILITYNKKDIFGITKTVITKIQPIREILYNKSFSKGSIGDIVVGATYRMSLTNGNVIEGVVKKIGTSLTLDCKNDSAYTFDATLISDFQLLAPPHQKTTEQTSVDTSQYPDTSLVYEVVDEPPVPYTNTNPKAFYPETVQNKGITGLVRAQVTIDEKGNVMEIKILSSPHELLTDEVMKAVSRWKYKPGKIKGIPVKVKNRLIEIQFELD